MSLINNLQAFKLMRAMLISEHRTVTADCTLTSITIVVHWGVIVLGTDLFGFRLFCLKSINCCGHFLHKSAINKLVDPQRSPAMWALLPLFYQPFLKIKLLFCLLP